MGNLAILDSLLVAEIHARLFCRGRARTKAGCCQPPLHTRPWQELGLLSGLDTRRVSNKHALGMACVWHRPARSTHTPMASETPRSSPCSPECPSKCSASQTSSVTHQIRSIAAVGSTLHKRPRTRRSEPASYEETGRKSHKAMVQFPHKEQCFSTTHIFSES